jgi:hypothetical protein
LPRPGIAGLAALAAFAFPLVACDGDSGEKNDYVDEVNQVTATLQSGITEVASGARVESPDQARAVFEQFAGELEAAAADLEGIEPPEGIDDLHDSIVEDLRTLETEATGAANEIRSGGAAAVSGVAAQFLVEANRIGVEIDATISEINSELQE